MQDLTIQECERLAKDGYCLIISDGVVLEVRKAEEE